MKPSRTDRSRARPRIDEIRSAAGDLFLAQGYAPTTMNDIAQSVGILPGSLYHHFASKEVVAVEILDLFNEELRALSAQLRKSGHAALPPESRLRELCTSVGELSLRHAAAVRLRAFDPPTSSSDRFREAIALQPIGLRRLWRTAAEDLRKKTPDERLDVDLFVQTLQRISITFATTLPLPVDPTRSAKTLCDTMFYGLTQNTPSDDELDGSAPLRAAKDAVAQWGDPPTDDDMKAHILSSARNEFARRGFDATTSRDIVEASGVRMGSIYRRVPSMEGMFDEIARNFAEHIDVAMRKALRTDPADTAATIDAMAYVTVEAKRRFPDETKMMSLAWNQAQSGQPRFMVEYRKQVSARMTLLKRVLGDAKKGGTLTSPHSPTSLAPHVRNIAWIRFGHPERIHARREHLFLRNHLLRGVVTRPGADD